MRLLRSKWSGAFAVVSIVGLAAFGCSATPSGTGGAGGGGAPNTGGGGGAQTGGSHAGDGGPVGCTGAEDCESLGDACNVGACVNAVCGKVPANDGAPCDDGKTCTTSDVCQEGVCVGGQLEACPASDACHEATCDVTTDTCVESPANDGAPCDDDDACTLTGSCSGGACAPGSLTDCSFLDGPCSAGYCDSQVGCKVMPLNDGTPCDDGLFCTDGDVCTAGSCEGTPKVCVPASNPCLTGVCNELLAACINTPGNNGAACDDGDLCTGGETCSNGLCVGGAPANEGAACTDADGCTLGTTCQSGVCGNPTSMVVACVNGDSCCPANCPNDDDCAIDVLVVGSDDLVSLDDVLAKLVATAAFSSVTTFDASVSTPTPAELAAHKAVLAYSNLPFFNPTLLGDRLADYFDAGGRVVVAAGGNCDTINLGGRFINDGYMVMSIGLIDQSFASDSLGAILEPGSTLVAGVSTLQCSLAARCFSSPAAGATTVVQWATGNIPLIVRGTVQGRNRVDLNFFPPSVYLGQQLWTGDGAKILKNALLFK